MKLPLTERGTKYFGWFCQEVQEAETPERAEVVLTELAEYADSDCGHNTGVAWMAKILAIELGFSQFELLETAVDWHDVGKIAVYNDIKKPCRLTPKEFDRVKQHTTKGAELIETVVNKFPDIRLFALAYDIAYHHHQQVNGGGYPSVLVHGEYRPLREGEISLAARIAGICDVVDALRKKRVYKEGFSHEKVVAYIKYDPEKMVTGVDRFGKDVFEAFMDNKDRITTMYGRNNTSSSQKEKNDVPQFL